MLTSLADLLAQAERRRAAVGAFTVYNLEAVEAVLRAAQQRRAGVILLISPAAFRTPGGPPLVRAVAAAARHGDVPVCVQLDHVADPAMMSAALEHGVGALMADGSRLPHDTNLALVQQAARLARSFGANVEAELGRVEGDEDRAMATRAGTLTDPDEAAAFARAAAVQCLAVSVGNVHGHYAAPPQLEWSRLEALGRAVDVPLSLHGASGLRPDDLARAVALGIRKVNVNTELRERYFATITGRVADFEAGADVLGLSRAVVDALTDVVARILEALEPA